MCCLPALPFGELLRPTSPTLLRSPAIAGVSKRWWRVCWGSRQLWRDIAITHGNPGSPIATSATGPRLVSPESLQQRAENFKAAQRALLARVGRCAEVFTCHDDAFEACIPLSAVLSQLSPAALIDLDLQVPELYTEQAHQLAGFSGLTSLGIHARYSCHGLDATLRQLPRLQWLSLATLQLGDELVATLQTLSTLTRLVSAAEACGLVSPAAGVLWPATLLQLLSPRCLTSLPIYPARRTSVLLSCPASGASLSCSSCAT